MLCSEFSALADEYKVDLRCKSSHLFVHTDMTLLCRIVQNFLSNAFRYGSSGKVLLGCRRQGNELCLQVFDTGPGIAQDKQQHVFEQFTQLYNANAVGPKGLGLGLNIAQSLGAILNHKIALKSQPGHGCMFSVSVPITAKPVLLPQVPKAANSTLQGVKVLCIDNELSILAGMQDLLSAWKCEVHIAQNAQQAIQEFSAANSQFDFLLVDFQLQDHLQMQQSDAANQESYHYDGIDLICYLQNQSRYPLPAILITASNDEVILLRAQQLEIGYLAKVIKPIALRALMSSMLSRNLEKNYSRQ
jgi:CheY-like chemotaxis protein/anti-sigma regulatory factor (Ser/Thr protein kinase)